MRGLLTIPQASPIQGYKSYQVEIDTAIERVLSYGQYILGEEVRLFEAEFAAYVGVCYAVGVGSGTEALNLALWACHVGPGDEVITVSHTAVATVAAARLRGAMPVLVDIDPLTMTMEPSQIENAITPRTRAIIPVHLYGHPADLDPILVIADHYGIKVIEDCAQSHGARYRGRRTGSIGHLGCFSFYPTKNLGAIGDGGMVVTDDPELAGRVRLLRQYGWQSRYASDIEGTNSRLDELQAAILRVKLQHLDEDNARRQTHAVRYQELLEKCAIQLPHIAVWAEHCFHQYVVRSPKRDDLAAYLRKRGICTQVHYSVPIHLQPAYVRLDLAKGSLPHTERSANQVLSLPMYPELQNDQIDAVAEAIHAWQEDSGETI